VSWLLLLALLACAKEGPETPHAEPGIEPAPLIEAAPVQPNAASVPMNPRWTTQTGLSVLGDPITMGVTYELPNGCWRHESAVTEHADTRTIELAVTLRQEGDMCTQAIVTVEEKPVVRPAAVGDWTLTVSFNGSATLNQTATVALEAPQPIPPG